jgi:transposase
VNPELARSLKAQGASIKDIAARFGCSVQAVYPVLREGR